MGIGRIESISCDADANRLDVVAWQIADEKRTITQIGERLLARASRTYKKEGQKFMQRLVAKQKARFSKAHDLAAGELVPHQACFCETTPAIKELIRARFEQHLLPDDETLRKISRYESMLDRELHRCLDRLERMQARRAADPLRDLELVEGSVRGNGRILP